MRSVSEEREAERVKTSTKRLIKRQAQVKARSSSVPIQRRRHLSSGSGESEEEPARSVPVSQLLARAGGQPFQASNDTIDSVKSCEWDPTFDKCSTLKDDSDAWDLTVGYFGVRDGQERSDSVSANLAPADFAIDESKEEDAQLHKELLPILEDSSEDPSIVVELLDLPSPTNTEVDSDEEQNSLQIRLWNLREDFSMEETVYKARMKEIRSLETPITILLQMFSKDNITYEDRESYKDELAKIRQHLLDWSAKVTELVSDLQPDVQRDVERKDAIMGEMVQLSQEVANHAKEVKERVTEILDQRNAAHPIAQPQVNPAPGVVDSRKKDLCIKSKNKLTRLDKKAKDLIGKISKLEPPTQMKDRDIRKEINVDFSERDKIARDIESSIFDVLDDLSTLDEADREVDKETALGNLLEEMSLSQTSLRGKWGPMSTSLKPSLKNMWMLLRFERRIRWKHSGSSCLMRRSLQLVIITRPWGML